MHDSPLRYPGGKASLADFLTQTIKLNELTGCSYFEPFAGGAGAALRLLREGTVSEIHLNDFDLCIYAFWRAVIDQSERFAETIHSVPLDIPEWKRQREIYRVQDMCKLFELGFATFYLNRCNRSGMLFGAAPIGGYAQEGQWKLDVRFNKENLAKQVLAVGRKRDHIHITNLDAREFLINHLPGEREAQDIFTYLDPPYYSNGKRLYLNSYSCQDHTRLAGYIQRQANLKWVMSYDDTPIIRDLYRDSDIHWIPTRYSLQRKQRARELLIAPSHVKLPESVETTETRVCLSTQDCKGGSNE